MKRLPAQSIDFCMTSPPYWQLRNYDVSGQTGWEQTPEAYIGKLVLIFRELKRVLKNRGSFYLNLGDTYIGTDNCSKNSWKLPKQLALIPSRVAIALQEEGWILRSDICWYKPNGLPSPVKDRLSNRWEHLFHFVKQRKYYYDLNTIREPLKDATIKRIHHRVRLLKRTGRPITKRSKYFAVKPRQFGVSGFLTGKAFKNLLNKGRNPGDFWEISIKHSPGRHYAVYPEELCVRPIKSSCPPGGIVLDMFAGSGTTLLVAKKLRRRYIGCDLNREYVKLARKRLKSLE
jgi:DNA modification methylase